jgi:tetratricopeptide (TPR) repeat protein
MSYTQEGRSADRQKDMFNRARVALERGSADYAIELLTACLELDPASTQCRKYLWAARIQSYRRKGDGALRRAMLGLRNAGRYALASYYLQSDKAAKAMQLADRILDQMPLDLKTVMLFVRSAEILEMREVALQALEIARDQAPTDVPLLKRLGQLYVACEKTAEARKLYDHLVTLVPKDPEVLKAVKDTMAMESMIKGGWVEASEKGGSFRDMIRDTQEAALLEKQAKAVKTVEDADALVHETLARIEAEPGNVNYRKALARLYLDKGHFDEALDTLRQAININPGDPELDQALTSATLRQFDARIAELTQDGNQAEADRVHAERDEYAFHDLEDRVRRYPNELRLRFEWGRALFQRERLDEAIQEFQRSQRSPRQRQQALYYMAMCFRRKKQFDLALDQLKLAASELEAMDDVKKNVLYELGEICETTGNREEAARYFKMIYQADIGFRDIRSKVEGSYL